MLHVAVRLPATIDDVGEYLADVTALEAAGAAAIWVDDTGLEPWVLLGAMAGITQRVRLGCMLTSTGTWPSETLESTVTTLQKLSRGRLMVGVSSPGQAGSKVFATGSKKEPPDGLIFEVESADQLSGAPDSHIEVWAAIAVPPDRAGWAEALTAYEAAGATGVIVSWNARVLDLLRNPEPDDRTDLLISTG
ncbi:MAG TPA: LLM class flavin-dependent oxidoreductase [Candidatus Dormibacteraeota bacterium]|nr:LLM class flavin-dependent oxidoreductase [Candidatus Dormibacteraeota bacterium]